MKLLRTLRLLLTDDDEEVTLFDAGALDRSVEDATVAGPTSGGTLTVAAAAEGQAVPMGGVTTAGFIFLASDKDIVVRLNGGDEDIPIKAGATARGVLYLEGAVTELEIDNPGATAASVLFALAGV